MTISDRPKLAPIIASDRLAQHVEKKLFRGEVIRMGSLLTAGTYLFATGAALGHAFRDRMPDFIIPFSSTDRSGVELFERWGREIEPLANAAGSLPALFTSHEMRVAEPRRALDTWAEWMMSVSNQTVDAATAMQFGVMYMIRGAAFGAAMPDRLETLYADSLESMRENLPEMARLGLATGPMPVPFTSWQSELVEGFREFCQEYYPESLEPLGLTMLPPSSGGTILNQLENSVAIVHSAVLSAFVEARAILKEGGIIPSDSVDWKLCVELMGFFLHAVDRYAFEGGGPAAREQLLDGLIPAVASNLVAFSWSRNDDAFIERITRETIHNLEVVNSEYGACPSLFSKNDGVALATGWGEPSDDSSVLVRLVRQLAELVPATSTPATSTLEEFVLVVVKAISGGLAKSNLKKRAEFEATLLR